MSRHSTCKDGSSQPLYTRIMSREGGEKPKSPWAKGEEYERELGPKGVKAVEKEQSLSRLGPLGQVLKEGLKRMEEFDLQHFRRMLEDVGGTFSRSYAVGKDGYIQEKRKLRKYFQGPDLLTCLVSDAADLGRNGVLLKSTPDELRDVARIIMGKYPDIIFEFQESPERKSISYTVTLKEG